MTQQIIIYLQIVDIVVKNIIHGEKDGHFIRQYINIYQINLKLLNIIIIIINIE